MFGAIVYLISVIGLTGPLVDALCIATLAARIVQSCVHISHAQTNAFVVVRFSFYSVQLVSFLVLIVMSSMESKREFSTRPFAEIVKDFPATSCSN